jgi:hypothetical protein
MSVDTTFAYPVDERIAQVAQQRLESIDIITGVIRESRNINNWTPEDRQILLIKDPPQRATEFDTIGNPPGIAYTMNLHVRCHVLQSQVADEPVEELLSIIVADAVRAITNAADWHKLKSQIVGRKRDQQRAERKTKGNQKTGRKKTRSK